MGPFLPIKSSVITAVEYDEEMQELDIAFTSGKIYRYFDVPLAIYAEFLDAASKGEFFNSYIKDAFRFAEVGKRRRRLPCTHMWPKFCSTKITAEVREHASGLADKERAALYSDLSAAAEAMAQAGMDQMSKKFIDMGTWNASPRNHLRL